MEGKLNLFSEISHNQIEGEYILFSLKGLLNHLTKVEEKIFHFCDVLTYDDFLKISKALKTFRNFLKIVLSSARSIKTVPSVVPSFKIPEPTFPTCTKHGS